MTNRRDSHDHFESHHHVHHDPETDEQLDVIRASITDELPAVVVSRWTGLRLPLLLIGAAFTILAASTLILVAVVLRSESQTSDQIERAECAALFDAAVGEGDAEMHLATSVVIAEVVMQALDPDDANLDTLRSSLATLETATDSDRELRDLRDAWFADGRPTPCPLEPGTNG